MGNLGWYQLMTTMAKAVGGPKRFMGIILGGGLALGGGLYAGGAAVKRKIDRENKKKRDMEASAVIYTVDKESRSNEGLLFRPGEKFKILERDGDAGLIIKLGDTHNPYFVSLKFLRSISDFKYA